MLYVPAISELLIVAAREDAEQNVRRDNWALAIKHKLGSRVSAIGSSSDFNFDNTILGLVAFP